MVLYTQTQQDCVAVEVSIAFSNTRVWLVLEDYDINRQTYTVEEEIKSHLVMNISSNPKYIDWLVKNRHLLKKCFDNNVWYISLEHIDGDHKYLRELKYSIAQIVNLSESGYQITITDLKS
jgi:hypothetical protein